MTLTSPWAAACSWPTSVADNTISHAHELRGFLRRVENDPTLETLTLSVGSGVQLAYKRR